MAVKTVRTFNPATGEQLASYEVYPEEKALAVVGRASLAFDSWSSLSVEERGGYFRRLASVLRSRKSVYAKTMTLEMGKPISQSEAEVEKCALGAEYYAQNAASWLGDEVVGTDAKTSYVTFQPLGVILSVMPWNFPFWQALRFAIPTLIAGNTSVLRHSNVCPGSALAIEESFKLAGFPDGVFSAVITDHETVKKLIGSPSISGVSLTGSTEAGRTIGEEAVKNFKKLVLELGGSDPFVVLGDADVERAAKVGATARLQNSGQSCICAKRFIVVRSVAAAFTDKLVGEFQKRRLGDPLDPKTDVGPLVNADAVAKVDGQVKNSVAQGAEILTGGSPRSPGCFYEPTILNRVDKGMKVMTEEVFGPAAPVYVVEDEREAIKAANESEFGLGASIWTSDLRRAKKVALEIQSGMVFVNELTKSDPRMPFGGIKQSGLGRELSKYGLKEFVNVKSVNIY